MKPIAYFAAIALGIGALAAPACDSDGNPKPPGTGGGTSSTTSSSTTSSGTGGATTSSSSGTGGTGTGGGNTGGGGAAPNCDGPNGCYSCTPTKNEQFLNACTSAQCSPFDNAARLPQYNNGNLPPVP
jgi:hypothetical protein